MISKKLFRTFKYKLVVLVTKTLERFIRQYGVGCECEHKRAAECVHEKTKVCEKQSCCGRWWERDNKYSYMRSSKVQ